MFVAFYRLATNFCKPLQPQDVCRCMPNMSGKHLDLNRSDTCTTRTKGYSSLIITLLTHIQLATVRHHQRSCTLSALFSSPVGTLANDPTTGEGGWMSTPVAITNHRFLVPTAGRQVSHDPFTVGYRPSQSIGPNVSPTDMIHQRVTKELNK